MDKGAVRRADREKQVMMERAEVEKVQRTEQKCRRQKTKR